MAARGVFRGLPVTSPPQYWEEPLIIPNSQALAVQQHFCQVLQEWLVLPQQPALEVVRSLYLEALELVVLELALAPELAPEGAKELAQDLVVDLVVDLAADLVEDLVEDLAVHLAVDWELVALVLAPELAPDRAQV